MNNQNQNIIKQNNNVNQKEEKDKLNRQFLQYCSYNNITNINKTLDAGCDIYVKDNDGLTGFHLACMKGHLEVVQVLLNNGMDITIKDKGHCNGFHLACEEGHLEVIKLLLNKGIELNLEDKNGFTGLHFACGKGHLQVVQLLLEKGMNMSIKDKKRFTAFHYACREGHYEVVKILLDKKNKIIYAVNEDCYNGFHLACEEGHLDIVKLLLERGVDYNLETKDDLTGLQLSTNQDIIKFLTNLSKKDDNSDNYKIRHTNKITTVEKEIEIFDYHNNTAPITDDDHVEATIKNSTSNRKKKNYNEISRLLNETMKSPEDHTSNSKIYYDGFPRRKASVLYNFVDSDVEEKKILSVVNNSSSKTTKDSKDSDSNKCNICDYQGLNSFNYDQHCMSFSHQEQLSNSTRKEILALQPFLRKTTFYCKECDFSSMSKGNYIYHYKSASHKENSGKTLANIDLTCKFRCGLKCNFSSEDRFKYQKHIQSNTHISNIPNGTTLQKEKFLNEIEDKSSASDISSDGDNYVINFSTDNNNKKSPPKISSPKKSIQLQNDKKQLYYCNICDYETDILQVYYSHCMAKRHKEAISTASTKEILALPPYLMQKTFVCIPCDIENMIYSVFHNHCISDGHKSKSGTKVTSKIALFRCGLKCNFTSEDRFKYQKHVQSSEHVSNIPKGKVLQQQVYLKDESDSEDDTKDEDKSSNKWFCNICNYKVKSTQHFDVHCNSNKHKDAVADANPKDILALPSYLMSETYICKVCDYSVTSKGSFAAHCTTEKHLSTPGSNSTNPKKGIFICGLKCNFRSEDRFEYQDHVQSKEHKSNIPKGMVFQKERFLEYESDSEDESDDDDDEPTKVSINNNKRKSNEIKNLNNNESLSESDGEDEDIEYEKFKSKQSKKIKTNDNKSNKSSIVQDDSDESLSNDEFKHNSLKRKYESFSGNSHIYCNVCDYQSNSRKNYDFHCMGKNHSIAVSKATKKEVLALPYFLVQKTFACEPCNYETLGQLGYQRHCASSRHSQISGTKNINGTEEAKFRCGLKCNFTTLHRYNFEKHVQSKEHLSNIQKGAVLQKQKFLEFIVNDNDKVNSKVDRKEDSEEGEDNSDEETEYYCKLCDYTSNNVYNYDKHCVSQLHLKVVAKSSKKDVQDLPPYLMQKTFFCKECDYECILKTAFIVHLNSHNHLANCGKKKIINSEIINKFRCKFGCKFTTDDRDTYQKHVRSIAHIKNIPKGVNVQNEIYIEYVDDVKNYYVKKASRI